MERLDKIISNMTNYSRKEVKELVRQKRVVVNRQIVAKADIKIDSSKDIITIDNIEVKIKKYIYLILHKPEGYVSATKDKTIPTVLDLVPSQYSHRNLFPAGRLDKDTTGLMLITDDGEFAHNILSPKKHIRKLYEVTIDIPITNEMVIGFRNGISLNDGDCRPANLQITGQNTGIVTLTEGKYHQIKRMFGCYKAKVIKLHRIAMGEFLLPDNLKVGECRELTNMELEKIKSIK